MSMIRFRNYQESDYEAVCDFLIELNRSSHDHINWNWARFEWMYFHPEFKKDLINSIGLWSSDEKIIGAAIYDMYFGEAFCGALPAYDHIYPEILRYAYKELKDDSGLGIAVNDKNLNEIEEAAALGFAPSEQTETIMAIDLDRTFRVDLPVGMRIEELDPVEEPHDFQWVLWQGFDHGDDKEEFARSELVIPDNRPHFRKQLSLTAVDPSGEKTAYCCLWFHEKTDYAYIEPVCTIPEFRGKGIAKALLMEGLNQARGLGARKACVISDMDFYAKAGLTIENTYTFYHKN